MQKSAITGMIILLVVISIGYTAYSYMQDGKERKESLEGHLPAIATITKVYPPRVTRYGAKQSRYGIEFTDAEGKKQSRGNCFLGEGRKVGDTLTILYSPTDPIAEIVPQR